MPRSTRIGLAIGVPTSAWPPSAAALARTKNFAPIRWRKPLSIRTPKGPVGLSLPPPQSP